LGQFWLTQFIDTQDEEYKWRTCPTRPLPFTPQLWHLALWRT